MEIENFPLPGSLRLIGVERELTSLGVERGRLPHLYKTGKDTCAIFHLLLHGVSRLNYAGLGDDSYAQFPDWTMAEQKDALLHDLRTLCHTAQRRYPLEGDDLLPWVGRFRLQLIGGIVNPPSHPVHLQRFETPMPSMDLDWKIVAFV